MNTVADHLTACRHVADWAELAVRARDRMRRHRVRALAVTHEGEVVGVLWARSLEAVDERCLVRDVMETEVFAVDAETDLSDVVATMASANLNAAVVLERGTPVGLFTTSEALAELARRLVREEARELGF